MQLKNYRSKQTEIRISIFNGMSFLLFRTYKNT